MSGGGSTVFADKASAINGEIIKYIIFVCYVEWNN